MKKVVSGDILKEKMKEAINLLCDSVKVTLGPKGHNVIIDHSSLAPYITNDGVTIALNIESEDEVVNTILELAKEASVKTNDDVGDGTTTTLVLLQKIFMEGLKEIENGKNPILLKKELDNCLEKVIELLLKEGNKPTEEDYIKIATTSANSEVVGNLLGKAFNKVKNKNAIIIEEGESKTECLELKGYSIDTFLPEMFYLNIDDSIEIKDSYVLIFNCNLVMSKEVINIFNYLLEEKKNLVIIADDYSDEVINQGLALNMENDFKIYFLKNPLYGYKKRELCKDLATISKTKVLDSLNDFSYEYLGEINKIVLKKDKVTFNFKNSKSIQERVDAIFEGNLDTGIDREFNLKRKAMLKTGIILIRVGAPTEVERRELKMRFDDALWALGSCNSGVVIGSGLIYYKIANLIDNRIINEALKEPFKQIMLNSGYKEEIITEIIRSDYKKVFNVKLDKYEDIKRTMVLDPLEVLINSLKNAISIAGMLLTTNTLVINEYKDRKEDIL